MRTYSRRRKLRYEIDAGLAGGDYVWQNGKVIFYQDRNEDRACCTHQSFRTWKLACRAFMNCPKGSVLIMKEIRNGKRYESMVEKI